MIIIPDVHGRIFWEYPLFDNQDKHWGEHFIFLGDYLDPCPRENLPPDFAFWNLQNILEWKINDPDMITLLLGNHDLHYLSSRAISSHIDSEHQADIFAKENGCGPAEASGLKKISSQALSNLTPHPLVVFVKHSHPTLADRVEFLEI